MACTVEAKKQATDATVKRLVVAIRKANPGMGGPKIKALAIEAAEAIMGNVIATVEAESKDSTEGATDAAELTNRNKAAEEELGKAQKETTEATATEVVEEVEVVEEEGTKTLSEDKFIYGNTVNSKDSDWSKADIVEKDVHGNIEGMQALLERIHTLDGKEDPKHLEYLKGLLGKMSPDFFEKMTTYIETNTKENSGITKVTSIGLKIRKGSTKKYGNEMSASEIYVHEVIHAMTMFALQEDTLEAKKIKSQLQGAMDTALKNTKAEDLLPEVSIDAVKELAVAEDMIKYLFQGSTGTEEFIAHALTNPILMKHLSTVMVHEKTTKTIMEKILNIYATMMDILSGNYTFKDRHANVQEQVAGLAFQLADINKRAIREERSKINLAGRLWNGINKVDTKAADLLEDTWEYIVGKDKGFTKPPKEGRARALWMAKALFKMLGNAEYRKAFHLILSGMGIDQRGDFMTILRDFSKGDAASDRIDMLAALSDKVDTAKGDLAFAVASLIHAGFGKDKTLTSAEEVALTKVLIDTDMASIYKQFGRKTLAELLRNPKELKKRISRTKHKLGNVDPANKNWNIAQADGLGYFMATGKAHIAQNLNAANIANGTLSGKFHKGVVAKDGNRSAESLIDEVATLTALLHTNDTQKAIVAELMTKHRNGVENIIATHERFKIEASNTVFEHNKKAMIKGYSRELYDDKVSMAIAPLKDEQAMLTDGYKLKYAVSNNQHDRSGSKMGVYISDAFETAEYYRTATRLTSTKSKGSTITDIMGKDGDTFSRNKAKANIDLIRRQSEKIAKSMIDGTYDRDNVEYGLVPVIDSDGEVTDYRYMMSKKMKEEDMGQKLEVSDVLSHSFSHTLDKQKSGEQNKKVLDMIFDDMRENYNHGSLIGNNVQEYIVISKESTDPEVRELYSLLPPIFKQAIAENEYKELAVRADLFHSYFGYRHMSIGNAKLLKQITPKVLMRFLKIAEKMWMEFIKISKIDILIKMPAVIIGNLISNFFYGVMTGTTPRELIREYMNSTREVTAYFRRHKELQALKIAEKTGNIEKLDLRRIPLIEEQMFKSSIHELAELGIYQSIVEDMEHKEIKSTNKVKNYIDEKMKPLPEVVKSGLNLLYLTEGGVYHTFMSSVLTKSDLIARDIENRKMKIIQKKQAEGKMALPKWFVMRNHDKIKGVKYTPVTRVLKGEELKEFTVAADKNRRSAILNAFVNYNKPSGRGEEYLNKMGAIMFTKYAKRIQRVIGETTAKSPLKVLALLLGESYIYDVDTIYDQNILTRSWYNLGLTSGDMIPGTNPIDRILEVINPPLIQLVTSNSYNG